MLPATISSGVRQLCSNLNIERIYTTVACLLIEDGDLEFDNVAVPKLKTITSPELSDFRERLKNLET